jgi:DNA-binding CsgD family transcriptional regulator/tetratricopeptide (TPR) repeat protein
VSLVGRDHEWKTLTDAISALERGTGSCIVLTGVAGIGKTRLLEGASSLATELNLLVARGRATELDRVAPLSTLVTAVRPILGQDWVLPNGVNQYWQIDLIAERLEEVTRERPVVVVIDDAQWTDELSALALRVLVPRLSLLPILWLLARSPVPADLPAESAIRWLIGDGVREMELRPLSDDAVAELCEGVLGVRAGLTVTAIVGRSGGNPFLVEEVLRYLRATERVVTSDGTASVVGSELPSGFLSAVDQRLHSLSLEVRQLLQIGAVLGGVFSLHTAAALLQRPVREVMTIADEAVASGTLVDSNSRLAFQHDLVREAVYNNMNGAVRSMLHRAAATVLRAGGRPVVEIADHLAHGEYRGDVNTVELLRAAAGQMAACAPSTSADLLLRAVEILEDTDQSRPMLISDAVRMLASTGRLAEARAWGEQALRGQINPDTEGQLLLGLAESHRHAGHNTVVVELTDRGLALPQVDGSIRAQLYAIRAHAQLATDLKAAEQAAEQAVELGTRQGVSAAVAFGSAARSLARRARGDLDGAIRFARNAVAELGRASVAAEHRHTAIWMGAALVAQDHFEEAENIYAAGQQEAERLGTAWSLPLWHFYRASLCFARGRLSDVEAEAEAGLRIAEQVGAWQLGVPLTALLSRVAVLRDQLPLARDYLQRMHRILATGITVSQADAGWAAAAVHDAGGDVQEAFQALTELCGQLPERVMVFVQDPGAFPAVVRISKLAGRPGEAAWLAIVAAGLARRNPGNHTLAGVAAHAEGLVRMDVGRLNESVEILKKSRRPLVRASAIEDAAVAEHAAGRKGRAAKLLETALGIYHECGARREQLRVERRMHAIGVRRQAGSAAVESPLAGITQAERQVVELVVKGATNREVARQLFLSPHTVDSHLRKVFAKLRISSRVALTRIVMANADIT